MTNTTTPPDPLTKAIDKALEYWPLRTPATTAVQAVMEIHHAWPWYIECGHDHSDDPDAEGVVYIDDLGHTCQDGLRGYRCRVCCDDDGNETEECASCHVVCWPCPTVKAIAETLDVAAF